MTFSPGVGIVHLSAGALFKAFVVPRIEDAMEETMAASGDWAIRGNSLRSRTHREVTSLRGMPVAPEAPEAVFGALRSTPFRTAVEEAAAAASARKAVR